MIKRICFAPFVAFVFVIGTLSSTADTTAGTTSDAYLMGFDDRIIQDFQSIARNWEKLRNYPYAIVAYRELIHRLPYKKFAVADAWYQIGRLYQQRGLFFQAIDSYDVLIKQHKVSNRWQEGVYQQGICYQTVQEYVKAYENFKAYISYLAGKKTDDRREKRRREVLQIVQQMERDEDGDGYMFYQEQEAMTSDQDANDYPLPLSPQEQ